MNVWSAGLISLVSLTASAIVWTYLSRHRGGTTVDRRLTIIYFAALVGALLGAKFAFLITEGWTYRTDIAALVSGRSITGALLGGYGAVELAKRFLNYHKVTGDLFALVVPMSLLIGRISCLVAGCCPGAACDAPQWWTIADSQGIARWPAVPVEMLFNTGFLGWVWLAHRQNWQPGQRFHIFLITYGIFRFAHEFLRDNATWFGPIGGYHLMALLLIALGFTAYRARMPKPMPQ